MEGILAAFAQFDNDVKAERTVVGMKAAIDRGRWTFQAPIGYLNSPGSAGQSTLIPDTERGAIIKKAFELYATGQHSKNDVLRVATTLGASHAKG